MSKIYNGAAEKGENVLANVDEENQRRLYIANESENVMAIMYQYDAADIDSFKTSSSIEVNAEVGVFEKFNVGGGFKSSRSNQAGFKTKRIQGEQNFWTFVPPHQNFWTTVPEKDNSEKSKSERVQVKACTVINGKFNPADADTLMLSKRTKVPGSNVSLYPCLVFEDGRLTQSYGLNYGVIFSKWVFRPDADKYYKLRAYCDDGHYYDVGCYSGYSLYAYHDMDDWSAYGNANKFRIIHDNKFGDQHYEIRLAGDAGEYNVYNSTENCNGWYVKCCDQPEGKNLGPGVNNFVIQPTLNHTACGEPLYYIKSGGYWWWCSDHAGAGNAWYIKASNGKKPTGFVIQEF